MFRGRGIMRGRHLRRAGLGRLLKDPALRERLGFTAEQAAKIEAQENAFAKSRVRQHADLRLKHMELRELMESEKPDRAAIDRKLRELQDARTVAHKTAIDHRLAMRELITPEQRDRLREIMRERWMGHGGPGRGPRGPRPPAAPEAPQKPEF
jgi:Spy/CpxP family protein refolding chaperone